MLPKFTQVWIQVSSWHLGMDALVHCHFRELLAKITKTLEKHPFVTWFPFLKFPFWVHVWTLCCLVRLPLFCIIPLIQGRQACAGLQATGIEGFAGIKENIGTCVKCVVARRTGRVTQRRSVPLSSPQLIL